MRCLHRGVGVVARCAVRAAATRTTTTSSSSSASSCLSAATMYAVPPLHNTHELCRWFAGDTGEYRQRVRTALLQAQAAPAADDTTTTTTTTDKDDGALRNFTQRRSNSNTTTTPAATAQRTRELLCALAQAQMLPSMAQLRRPGHAAAMAAAAVLCDVVATADVPLALLAATHLTAASVLATHASRALHRQLSSNNNSNNNSSNNSNKDTRSYDDADVDACRVVCCVAARELVAQPAPTHGQRRGLLRSLLQVHTQATYDALDEEQKVQQQVQQLQQQQQQQAQQQQQQRVRPLQFGAVCDTCVPHTEAYYDVYAQTFVLSGAGKFAVVGAACADVALVTATLYTADESYNNNAKKKNKSSSNDTKRKTNNNDGTQRSSDGPVIVPHVCVFAVRLRERGGALCAGVRIEPLVGEHTLYEAAGVALLHLHNVAVPVHCLLRPHRVTRHGVLTMDAEGGNGDGEDSGDGDVNNKTKKSNNSSTSATRMHDTLRAAAQYVTRRTHAMTMSLMSAASSSSAQQQLLPALPVREEDVARHATTALHTRARLLAAGVCAGVLTTLMTSVTRFVARRHVAGYTGVQHDYLYMSLQHVQHQVTTAVAYGVVALLAWQQRDVHEDTAAPPVTRDSNSNNNDNNDDAKSDDGMLLCCTYSERLRIACVLCALQEAVVRMSRVAHASMGVHASFASSGVDTAMAALHVLQDSIDQAQLLHDIAAASSLSSASGHRTRNTSPHSSSSPLSRLLRHLVPLRADNSKTTTTTTSSSSSSHTVYTTRQQRRYEHRQSPLLAAEWRQLAEEHTHAIGALHAAMTSAEQHTAHVNHAEAVWHAWWTLHARDVHVCGAARVDMHLVRSVDWVQAQCRDVYVRQLLCDVVLVYTAARQAERMACDMPWTTTTSSSLWTLLPPSVSALLSALRRRRAVRAAYEEHEEAVARVAGHCVALVDALAVPPSAWAPCALSSRVWRAYWSIPGTLSEDEVAAAVCERRGEAKQWRRQHPQPRPRDVRSRDDDDKDEDDDNSSSSSSRAADDEDDEVDEALRNPLYDDMLHGLADDKATTTAATRHARLTERTARN